MIHYSPLSYTINGNCMSTFRGIIHKICHCGRTLIKNDMIITPAHHVYEDQCNVCVLDSGDILNEKYNELRPYTGCEVY